MKSAMIFAFTGLRDVSITHGVSGRKKEHKEGAYGGAEQQK